MKNQTQTADSPVRKGFAFIVASVFLITLGGMFYYGIKPKERVAINQPVVQPQVGVEWPAEKATTNSSVKTVDIVTEVTNTVTSEAKVVVTNNTLTLNFENFKFGVK